MTHHQEQNSEWIEHDGKGMPVPGRTQVQIRQRNGVEYPVGWHDDADTWQMKPDRWTWSGLSAADIVAYRLHKPTPSSQGDAQ